MQLPVTIITRGPLACALLLVACGDDGQTTNPDTGGTTNRDGGVSNNDGGPTGPSIAPSNLTWSTEVVEEANTGIQLQAATAPDGRIGIAFFRSLDTTGTCMADPNTPVSQWEVGYAEDTGSGFNVETVITPLNLLSTAGLSLAFDDNSNPAITFVGGSEGLRRCGSSDLMLARKSGGNWSITNLASDATSTPVFQEDVDQCAAAQNTCNVGDAEGEWSSLAFQNGQPSVAFRDAHFGFTQDDELRSDLELIWAGNRMAIDAGFGGGTYAGLTFDSQGNPVVAHYRRYDHDQFPIGIWISAYDGSAWQRKKVADVSLVGYRLGFGSSGASMGIAYHDTDGQRLVYHHSDDDGANWDRTVVVQDNAISPGFAFDPYGSAAFSYRHCPYNPNGTDCEADEDHLGYAIRIDGRWRVASNAIADEVTGFDGVFTDLTFTSEGLPVIAYLANFFDPSSGESIFQLKVAKGARK